MTFYEEVQMWEADALTRIKEAHHENTTVKKFGCKYYCGTSGNTEYLINTKAIFSHLPYAKYLKK